ncbi:MAG: TonB-dependent receptor [Candidatus Hydrothermales bacterium]
MMSLMLLVLFLQFEEMTLEELLKVDIYALKIPVQVKNIPAEVVVIEREEIEKLKFRDLPSLIAFLAGFYLVDDRTFKEISLRGIASGMRNYTRTVKVLLNGFPIDFKHDGCNFIGEEFIPIETIERIEIVKGPSSSIYGKDALLGVINIITKKELKGFKAEYSPFYRDLRAFYNTYNYEYSFSFSERREKDLSLYKTSPIYERFENKKVSDKLNRNYCFYRGVNSRFMNFDIKSYILAQKIKKALLFTDYSILEENSLLSLVNSKFFIGVSRKLKNLAINTNFLYSLGFNLNDEKIEIGVPTFYKQRNFSFNTYEGNFEISSNFDHLFMLLGYDYSFEFHDLIDVYTVERETGNKILDRRFLPSPQGDTLIKNFGVYSSLLIKLFKEKIYSNISFRIDENSLTKTQRSYRLGFSYLPLSNLYLKFDYGKSFRAPTVSFLFSRPINEIEDIVPNPNLKGEDSKIFESSLGYLKGNTYLTLSFYYTKMDNKIEFVPKGVNFEPKNLLEATGFGYEIKIKTKIFGFDLLTSFYSSFIKFKGDTLCLPSFPQYMSFSYIAKKLKFIEILVLFRYISKVRSSLSNERINLLPYFIPHHYVFDVNFVFFNKINLMINNLFDYRYGYPGYRGVDIPGKGREISIRVQFP